MLQEEREKIAIIGLGCKAPGANNAEEFWNLLRDGENHVIEIPESRWFHQAVYDEDFNAPARTHARKAGLLKDHLAFDNKLFNIKDVEAGTMDPQQRYVLECVHMAMEDAGITRVEIKGSRTSVYVGAMNTDHRSEFNSTSVVPDSYTVTGVSSSIISSRVAYVYDLRGAAVTVDTACSSSLVAIQLGVQALRSGDCDMALCGGTNSILTPDVFIHLSKARMVSANGQCFTFSDQVDGYTRGEGCGMVILKRLTDAKRDNNKILSTIEIGCNQDGGTVAPISKPSEEQQIRLLEEVYSKSRIDPNRIDYIEAHGTGTPVGDVIEVNALGKFFQKIKAERHRYIGSVKTNIGHLESAAGVAGLIKVLLMIRHSKIIPHLNFERPNPNIDFKGMNLSVPTDLIDWPNKNKVACLSSYGFGGTNCHAVIESHEDYMTKGSLCQSEVNSECIVCFSGMNLESLKGSMKNFLRFPGVSSINMQDLAFTSTIHRDHFPVRQAFVADTTDSLLTQITDQLVNLQHDQTDTKKPNIVFVFSGMGTPWAGMGVDLMTNSRVFRNTIRDIDNCLIEFVPWSVEGRLSTETDMTDQLFWPIAIFSCQIALANLWKSLGVFPAFVVGYSVGEVAAAHISGYLSLSDAVKVIYHRTNVLAEMVGVGKMILFKGVDIAKVERVVEKWSDTANISAKISPKTCAVSGDTKTISMIDNEMRNLVETESINLDVIDLNLPLAYHSHCVEKCKEKLRQVLNGIGSCSHGEGNVVMISTVTGEKVIGPLNTEYWMNNMREPVLFLNAMRKTVGKDGNNVYMEVGPKPLMSAHAKDIFPEENVKVVVSMRSQGRWTVFLKAVTSVYKHGCRVIWAGLPVTGQSITPVPRYSFSPRRILQSSETSSMIMAGLNFLRKEHPFVFRIETTSQYRIFLSVPTFKSVFDHNVSGNLVIPGALYAECGFALSKQIHLRKAPLYSVSATFEQPCLFSEKEPVIFDLVMNKELTGDSDNHFDSYSIAICQKRTLFATVHLHPHYATNDRATINIPEVLDRCQQTLERQKIYQKLAEFGLNYGPCYKLLKGARKNANECITDLSIPEDMSHEISGTTVHPSILDAMIQTNVILTDDGEKKEVLPVSIGNVTPFRPTEDKMYIYTNVKNSYGNIIVFDSILTTLDGEIIVAMDSLTLQFFSSKAESATKRNSTENQSICTWVLKESNYPISEMLDPRVLYISHEAVPPEMIGIKYTTNQDCSEAITAELEIMKRSNMLDCFSYIVFNASVSFDDYEDAANIQSKIVNLCMVLKSVFCYPLKIPVYVFTKWAVAAEKSLADGQKINPSMTTVWGMSRSANIEQIADIAVFDLHLPPSQCTLERMTSVSDFIYRNGELKRYKEWMVTADSIFINQIIQLNGSIPAPAFRHISADKHKNVIQVCNGAVGSPDTFNVYDESTKCDYNKDNLVITVSETALQHPNLFHLSIPYNSLEPNMTYLGTGEVVFALETLGKRENGALQDSQCEIVSCCPCLIGNKVSVPACATVPGNMFDDYAPGDLTRHVTLMSLCNHINSKSVTVLTSSSAMGLGEILINMLRFKENLSQAESIHLVTIEGLLTGKCLKGTIVSLVLLDSSLTSLIVKHWSNAECLVTVAALINQCAKSLITYHLPCVSIIAPDSSDFFQPMNILQVVPKVKEWMAHNRVFVSQCVDAERKRSGPFSNVTADLNELLKVKSFKGDWTVVRVDHTSLFKKNGVYVVVGGLTGLGWIFVKYLSSTGAGNIAILNRRTPTEENRREIADLCKSGNCSIRCFQSDVCDIESLTNFFTSINTEFPGKLLKGIFFGAVAQGDAVLSNVTREGLIHVMSPKVMGAWNMHRMTKDYNLDYFVLFSSVTSVIGNFGQTSYGAANAFLDGLASYRRHKKLPGQSINWGPLTVGMLMNNEKAKQSLTQRGMHSLNEEDIMSLITPILLQDLEQIIACNFYTNVWLKNPLVTVAGSASYEFPIKDDLRRALQKAPTLAPEERVDVYTRYLIVLTAQVLGIDESLIKPDSVLQSLGMDSLLAMTVRNEIFKITQCRLPAVVLVSGDVTVKIIAETLDAEVQKEFVN